MEPHSNSLKFCINHPEKIVHSRGLCKNCYDKLLKQENPEFKRRQYENHKKWEESHKDRVKEYMRVRQILYSDRDKANDRKNWLKQKYNITVEEYLSLERASNNTCYICGRSPYENKHLHIDHDHTTGKVRGLLCARCNWYLATIEKNPEVLNKIKKYLEL
jgi:hypothetical protein